MPLPGSGHSPGPDSLRTQGNQPRARLCGGRVCLCRTSPSRVDSLKNFPLSVATRSRRVIRFSTWSRVRKGRHRTRLPACSRRRGRLWKTHKQGQAAPRRYGFHRGAASSSTRRAWSFPKQDLARQEKLMKSGATSVEDLDKARSTNDQNQHRVEQLEADVENRKSWACVRTRSPPRKRTCVPSRRRSGEGGLGSLPEEAECSADRARF